MPFTLISGASPTRLSRWVARTIAATHAESPQTEPFTWVIGAPEAIRTCENLLLAENGSGSIDYGNRIMTPADLLHRLCAPFLEDRTPIEWTESLHLLKRLLGEDRPLPALEYAARLLLRAKSNLLFMQSRGIKHAAILDKAVPPFSCSLSELYRAYQRELTAHRRYDPADLWEISFRAAKDKALVFPGTPHHLYWDRAFTLSPGERLWMKTVVQNTPTLHVYLTSPFSYRDEEDPFFTATFTELGAWADETIDLSDESDTHKNIQHWNFETSYEMLSVLAETLSEDLDTGKRVSIVDRLPALEKEHFNRLVNVMPLALAGFSPQDLDKAARTNSDHPRYSAHDRWLIATWKRYRHDAEVWGTHSPDTVIQKEEFSYYMTRDWGQMTTAKRHPSMALHDLKDAYQCDFDFAYIPFFHADVFPPVSPIGPDMLAIEPLDRHIQEIVQSTLFRYWQDRVLLRLFAERSHTAATLLSAHRTLRGDDSRLSPFTAMYPVTQGMNLDMAIKKIPLNPPLEKGGQGGFESALPASTLADLRRDLLAKPISVGKLEIFAQCPFRFLMEVMLKLSTPEDTLSLSRTLRGSLLHRALELAVSEPAPFDLLWPRLLQEFEAELKALPPFATAEMKRETAAAYDHVISHRLHQNWKTVAVEWNFKWPVSVDDYTFILSGRIDRVMEDPATGQFLIIDYKTGSVLPSTSELLQGDGLQLPLYLAAAGALLLPGRRPGGAMYWNLAEGEVKVGLLDQTLDTSVFDLSSRTNALISADTLADWQARALAKAGALVRALATTDFAAKPIDLDFCARACSWKRICRYPWMEKAELD